MGSYNIAVVGVGAVGEEMLKVLEERRFPTKSIRVLARSPRTIHVGSTRYAVEATTPESFADIDIALFAGTEGEKGAAVRFAEDAIARGAIVIDNGADFRMRPDVPLVVPEVNAEALNSHAGLIANPNCSTAQLVVALKPLHDAARVRRVIISTYQAVSGAGSAAVAELDAQNVSIANNRKVEINAFPQQIAYNVIPQIGGFDPCGYSTEEMKLVHETRKILGDDEIQITPVVAARVPVTTGHSEAVYVELEKPLSVLEALQLWEEFPGVEIWDSSANAERAYPTPVQVAGRDGTYIGRVRKDLSNPNALVFWVVADNLRKGAATNAVQIAEALVSRDLVRRNAR
jgi:aspartate-semialdehyde dehydrogenase